MKLQELRDLLKQQNTKGGSYLNTPELMYLLTEKEVLDSNLLEHKEQAKREMEEMKKLRAENDDRYKIVISIRNQPKRVEILDRETGEIAKYPSMYKAGQAFGFRATVMSRNNGKLWKNRYEIKVCD